MTFMELHEKLAECMEMQNHPDKHSRAECVAHLHKVLMNIPEWLDTSFLDPMEPLLMVYENYGTILLKQLNMQYFQISVTNRAGKEILDTLPTRVVEIGMKKYYQDVAYVPLSEPEPPKVILHKKIKLGFKKLDPRAQLPKYAHEGDAGMDIFALDDQDLPLYVPTLVHTGIAAEIPDGYEIQVRPRSGLACKGVTVWNSPGTVDSKYRGEICVILMYIHSECVTLTEKRRDHRTGELIDVGIGTCRKEEYHVKAGDKIAQLVLAPVTFAVPYEVEGELSETDRGTGGFGSTGR